jgi:hypothetical protein
MEAAASSPITKRRVLSTSEPEWNRVLAPKDYFLGPVFAAVPQTGVREVEVLQRRYRIGGFHPMGGSEHTPALDVRHARVIFSLLSFRDESFNEDGTRLIRFSFNELCRRYARSNGGRYSREIKKLVRQIMDSYIRITDTQTNISHSYRLIERIDTEERPPRRRDSKLARSNQTELWFNGCVLSPEFAGLLSRISELQHLRLDIFNSIRSPLAQAIYLYIPSRASHRRKHNPFKISLKLLLEQVSFSPVPHQKCRLHKLFTQHANEGRSILQQLDGLPTLKSIFHVDIAPSSDGADWNLLAWVDGGAEKLTVQHAESKLDAAYLASGRSRESLAHVRANVRPLSSYEIDLLEKAEVRLDGNEPCFKLAKAMLSPAQFDMLLAEAKSDALEGRKAKKNPTARLIWRLRQAISTPVQTRAGGK